MCRRESNPGHERGRVSRAAEVGAVDTPPDRTLAIRAGPCTVRAATVIALTANSRLRYQSSTFLLMCIFCLTENHLKSEQVTISFS